VLERELARGGMATVYLARDLKHKRNVEVGPTVAIYGPLLLGYGSLLFCRG